MISILNSRTLHDNIEVQNELHQFDSRSWRFVIVSNPLRHYFNWKVLQQVASSNTPLFILPPSNLRKASRSSALDLRTLDFLLCSGDEKKKNKRDFQQHSLYSAVCLSCHFHKKINFLISTLPTAPLGVLLSGNNIHLR